MEGRRARPAPRAHAGPDLRPRGSAADGSGARARAALRALLRGRRRRALAALARGVDPRGGHGPAAVRVRPDAAPRGRRARPPASSRRRLRASRARVFRRDTRRAAGPRVAAAARRRGVLRAARPHRRRRCRARARRRGHRRAARGPGHRHRPRRHGRGRRREPRRGVRGARVSVRGGCGGGPLLRALPARDRGPAGRPRDGGVPAPRRRAAPLHPRRLADPRAPAGRCRVPSRRRDPPAGTGPHLGGRRRGGAPRGRAGRGIRPRTRDARARLRGGPLGPRVPVMARGGDPGPVLGAHRVRGAGRSGPAAQPLLPDPRGRDGHGLWRRNSDRAARGGGRAPGGGADGGGRDLGTGRGLGRRLARLGPAASAARGLPPAGRRGAGPRRRPATGPRVLRRRRHQAGGGTGPPAVVVRARPRSRPAPPRAIALSRTGAPGGAAPARRRLSAHRDSGSRLSAADPDGRAAASARRGGAAGVRPRPDVACSHQPPTHPRLDPGADLPRTAHRPLRALGHDSAARRHGLPARVAPDPHGTGHARPRAHRPRNGAARARRLPSVRGIARPPEPARRRAALLARQRGRLRPLDLLAGGPPGRDLPARSLRRGSPARASRRPGLCRDRPGRRASAHGRAPARGDAVRGDDDGARLRPGRARGPEPGPPRAPAPAAAAHRGGGRGAAHGGVLRVQSPHVPGLRGDRGTARGARGPPGRGPGRGHAGRRPRRLRAAPRRASGCGAARARPRVPLDVSRPEGAHRRALAGEGAPRDAPVAAGGRSRRLRRGPPRATGESRPPPRSATAVRTAPPSTRSSRAPR